MLPSLSIPTISGTRPLALTFYLSNTPTLFVKLLVFQVPQLATLLIDLRSLDIHPSPFFWFCYSAAYQLLAQFTTYVIITTTFNNFTKLKHLNPLPVMKDFLTMSEISKLEQVTKQAVWYWVHKGIFPNARKVGNQIRIPIRDYHHWRESTKINHLK